MIRETPRKVIGEGAPRQRMWKVVRELRVDFSLPDIEGATGISRTAVSSYLMGLEKAGYLTSTPGRQWKPKHYTLVRDVGVEAPRVNRDGSPVTLGRAQEQMWRTLNLLTTDCNIREMVAHASTKAVPVSESTAGEYLRILYRAGYLKMTDGGRYRLLPTMRTGPRPPAVCRCDAVYDANLGKVVWNNAEEKADV